MAVARPHELADLNPVLLTGAGRQARYAVEELPPVLLVSREQAANGHPRRARNLVGRRVAEHLTRTHQCRQDPSDGGCHPDAILERDLFVREEPTEPLLNVLVLSVMTLALADLLQGALIPLVQEE